jgi:hypothetical protein
VRPQLAVLGRVDRWRCRRRPEIRTRGDQILSYASIYTGGAEQSKDPLVIVIRRDEFPVLVDVLEDLFDWFVGEIEKRGWR